VHRAYKNLPEQLKPITKTENTNELHFTHRFDGLPLDSTISVSLKGRAGTIHNLHITESAFVKDRQELVAGTKQAVPKTGRITEETTGNGYEDFYDLYMESKRNPNPGEMDYRAYFYSWADNPDYTLPGVLEDKTKEESELQAQYKLDDNQLLWRRWKIKELRSNQVGAGLTGIQLFKQEYPLTYLEAFQSGAGNVFALEKIDTITTPPPLKLDKLYEISRNEGEYKTVSDLMTMGVNFWHLPQPGKEYVIGVDPSDGNGSDNGVIDVWTRPNEDGKVTQVAQFYGKTLPDDLAELIKLMATYYNRAFVGVENNMLSTILFLTKIYDNYFMKVTMDERTQKKTKKVGWNTNIQTREKMIDDFIIHFDDDLLEINSGITVTEMKTFVRKRMASGTMKREHADGKHDDALFAAFIALQMTLYRRPQGRVFTGKMSGW
jgi:hypothetical protein